MQNEPIVASIVSILLDAFQGEADHPQREPHRRALSAQVERFVSRQRPLQLLLPGFPLKSPNTRDKTASERPDYAEYAALQQLDRLCRAISRVYPAGCALELFSDGLSFHDLLDIPRDTANDYHQRLRQLLASPVLRWHDYATISPGFDRQRDRAESVLRRYLPPAAADFAQPLPENQSARQMQWLGLLREDNAARGIVENTDWPQRALRLAWRGIALDAMLAEHFPDAIRLTIHASGAPGGKYPIRLSPAQAEAALPWHRVYLLNLAGHGELLSAPSTGRAPRQGGELRRPALALSGTSRRGMGRLRAIGDAGRPFRPTDRKPPSRRRLPVTAAPSPDPAGPAVRLRRAARLRRGRRGQAG